MHDPESITRPSHRLRRGEEAQQVFTGQIFSVYHWQQQLFDGSTATFESLSRKDSVGVLAITPEHRILVAAQEQPAGIIFTGLLGGIIENDETPLQTAQRELLEEAGGTAPDWQLWFATQPHIKIDWAVYMFIARNCQVLQPQQLDGGEKINLTPVSFDEFLDLVFSPDFRDTEVTLRIARMLHTQGIDAVRELVLGE